MSAYAKLELAQASDGLLLRANLTAENNRVTELGWTHKTALIASRYSEFIY